MLIRVAQTEYRTWTLDSRRWDAYVPRPTDIVIATSPKCGTTWTQQIVGSLVFGDPGPRDLAAESPWIEARFRTSAEELHASLEAQHRRRFVKTHLPLDGLPFHDDVRYIHAARDGRDAFMSMHNHFTGFSQGMLTLLDRIGLDDPAIGRTYPRPSADPAAFFRSWMTRGVVQGQADGEPGPSFFHLEASYWSERKRPNVLLVHFNDLKADLPGEMRRIAAFLGIEVREEAWPELEAAAGFEAMRAAGGELMPQTRAMFAEGGPDRFFHKGTNGRWHDVLTDADQALYAARVREKFSPGLAAWIEGGRAAAGDPAISED